MAKYSIEDTTLNNIADAIREKTGDTATLTPLAMPAAIRAITTGSGGDVYGEFLITGDASYLYAYQYTDGSQTATIHENWIKDIYLPRFFHEGMKTKDLTKLQEMFRANEHITEIPFDLNITSDLTQSRSLKSCFYQAANLKKLPKINGQLNNIQSFCQGCFNLMDVSSLADVDIDIDSTATRRDAFEYCYSLRHIPSSFLKKIARCSVDSSSNFYYYAFLNCMVLEAIEDLGVSRTTLTANRMTSMVNNCHRLRKFTFETNEDGTPIVAQWKAQTLDLTYSIGYGSGASTMKKNIENYSSGLPTDVFISDDATYAQFKDNPDATAVALNYSFYNHDSAVETINSLPDTSAYLAANSGTNTIKFKGSAGTNTDAGAISTLSEEEIAIAAAKGWTVTLV